MQHEGHEGTQRHGIRLQARGSGVRGATASAPPPTHNIATELYDLPCNFHNIPFLGVLAKYGDNASVKRGDPELDLLQEVADRGLDAA